MAVETKRIKVYLSIAMIAMAFMYICDWQLGFHLLGGWLRFFLQAIAHVRYRWDGILFCIIGFVVCVFLLHSFAKWFLEARAKAQGRESPSLWRLGHSVATVTLFLMMFVIVTAIAGVTHQVGWLISSPIDWYTSPVQSDEDNQLSRYRIGVIDEELTGRSWIGYVAPYLSVWIKDSDDELPWNDPHNVHEYRRVNPNLFNPRGTLPHKSPDGMGLNHFAGNAAILVTDKPLGLRDLGVGDTILVGEVNQALEPWGMPGNCRSAEAGLNTVGPKSPGTEIGFGTPSSDGVTMFGMLDTSVRPISKDIDPEVLRQLGKVKPVRQ